ncbi:hypothetical protein J3L18_05365 [Mucilaginibacter gossypii]|uniref:hypothetical protein n=1 Tax=Mucilaginibacter gossypii TaxID=551996 RepID=UPI000DCDBC88|nr:MULTISPECIES: hypothetical protein [Mucilaginibacter]QTE38507.1 hypothetical protein J3L18_05365 [Mucilaginibacter gossypii]RAV55756.1 hypothetical protein DIU36_16830 [Mucilaginibacter rubeus]
MDLTTDVLFADGQDNMAGLTRRLFLAFASSFTTLSTPAANPTTYAGRVTIADDHVLATGKKVIEVYIMYDKSMLESPSVGGRKGKSWKPKITAFAPGTDMDTTGLLDTIKNADLIGFAEPQEDAAYYLQVGTKKLPLSLVNGSWKSGTGPEGEKGITFELEAPSQRPVYFYTGDLPRVGA